jgi:predicted transposase YdaD
MWYTDAKVAEVEKPLLEQLMKDNLSTEGASDIMRTIADSYIEEGYNKGLIHGMQAGKEEGIQAGMEKGLQEGMRKVAINMIKSKMDLKLISSVTGFSVKALQKLESSI